MGLEAELARFGRPDSYLAQTNAIMQEKRDKMCAVLKEVGLRPIVPEGGYFVLMDTTSLGKDFDTKGPDKEPYDFQIAKWMIREKVCTDSPPLTLCYECYHFPGKYDVHQLSSIIKLVLQGLASIPPSVFFGPNHKSISGKLIRFCFYKERGQL